MTAVCVLTQVLTVPAAAAAAADMVAPAASAHTGVLGSCAAVLVGPGGGFDVTFVVNELGNLTQGPAGVYTYPTPGDGVARGQRALLHEDSTVTLTLDSRAERTVTSGGLTERRWYTIAGTVAAVQQHTPTGVVSWNIVLGDIRGSTAVTITRGTSTIISQWWTPYGERRGTRNDPIDTRGYLNQPEDSASGLSYLNARYLDPRLGIFISVDPLITTTNEPYLYAAGNPTTLSDPEGLCAGREGSRGGCGIDYFGGGGVDVNGGTGGAMRCGQGRHGLQGGACNSYGRTIDGDTWSTAANVAPRAGGPRIADGYWRPTPAAHRSGSCSWTCFTFAVSLAPVAGDAIDAFDCLNGSAVSCGVLPIPFLSGRVATGIDAMVQARRATEAARGFGGLSRAADFGPQSYRALSQELRGTGLQAHHLMEKRFADVLGQSADDMLAIAVTPAEHQVFTDAWRQAIPYGAGTRAATPELVTATARQVYADYPDILRALGLAG